MERIGRRRFLLGCGAGLVCASVPAYALWPFGGRDGGAPGGGDIIGRVFEGDAPETVWKWSCEASHVRTLEGGAVRCGICPHRCQLSPGDRSVCRSRVNVGGTLYSLVYGNPCAVHVDPIEKKPLFHFKPATRAFSIATTGCNLRCLNCQNWEISQAKPQEVRNAELFPERVVAEARRTGCASIAYTYSEPTTFYEYMRDTALLARRAGIANVWVSAGYINRRPLLELCRWIDGANVNLKSFSDVIYRKLNGARLQPVLNTFRTLHEQGVHFEMTNLVVPGYTDDPSMVQRMCAWIVQELGPDHPLHFTRFFPKYKLDRLAPTPVSTLERFREIAMAEGVRYVYVGNVPGHAANHTYCHHCGTLVVERQGYRIAADRLAGGRCRNCGTAVPGVWS